MTKLILAAFLISISSSALAQLTSESVNRLLGPYPASGSTAEARDKEELLRLQENRTEADCKLARLESTASLDNFFGKHHKILTPAEVALSKVRLAIPLAKVGVFVSSSKKHYKRKRPFLNWPEIVPCIPKPSGLSYPSGHATMAWMYSILLAKFYPERATVIKKRGEEAGQLRVLAGVHHPSDIRSGRVLGAAIAKETLKLLDL